MTTLNSRLKLALMTPKKAENALQKGFTLIELLIVVVIMGVLSAVALPNFIGAKDKADKGASLAATLAMAQECQNHILLGNTLPNFATNRLVTVTGAACKSDDAIYTTVIDQSVAVGDLCINAAATGTTAKKCRVTVDTKGAKTGEWV